MCSIIEEALDNVLITHIESTWGIDRFGDFNFFDWEFLRVFKIVVPMNFKSN